MDDRTGALFRSDCFGAVPADCPQDAAELDPGDLRSGQVRWATVDSSWVHDADRPTFGRALARFGRLEPSIVCRSHLAPAPGRMLPTFLDALARVPDAPRFVGPDQAGLELLLAGLGPTAA